MKKNNNENEEDNCGTIGENVKYEYEDYIQQLLDDARYLDICSEMMILNFIFHSDADVDLSQIQSTLQMQNKSDTKEDNNIDGIPEQPILLEGKETTAENKFYHDSVLNKAIKSLVYFKHEFQPSIRQKL